MITEEPTQGPETPELTEPQKTEPEAPTYTEKELREQLDRVAAATRREVQAKEAQRRAALEAERDAFKKRAEAGARPMPPDPSSFTKDDGTIDGAKYNTAMVQYEDRLHGWRQAQAVPAGPAAEAEPPAATGQAVFLERAAPLKRQYADFDAVVNQPLFTPEMATAIYDSDSGPEIAYFLGKNPQEADRVAGLQPAQMLREIGRLEARFAPNPKAVSSAPAPITPVTGTAGPAKDPEKMSVHEWMEWDKHRRLDKLKANPLGI